MGPSLLFTQWLCGRQNPDPIVAHALGTVRLLVNENDGMDVEKGRGAKRTRGKKRDGEERKNKESLSKDERSRGILQIIDPESWKQRGYAGFVQALHGAGSGVGVDVGAFVGFLVEAVGVGEGDPVAGPAVSG